MAILALLSRAGKAQNNTPGGKSMNTEQSITAEQKTTAQELIAANIKVLIEQLEAGNSAALTAYLGAMAAFIGTVSATCCPSHGKDPEPPACAAFMRGGN